MTKMTSDRGEIAKTRRGENEPLGTHFSGFDYLLADFFANWKTACQLNGELVSEMPIRISGIINEITGNVIIDLAGFWFFIDLAGKITNDVVR